MLGRNKIKRIENLNELSNLDVLDLHGNDITEIGILEIRKSFFLPSRLS